MSATTLLAAAALELVNLALFIHAGRLISRGLGRGPGDATRAFALFWYAVGAVNGLNAVLLAHAAFATPGVALTFALWNTRILLALAGFAALSYYVTYAYSGRAGARVVLAVFYLFVFALMQAWLIQSQPTGADVRDAWIGMTYAEPSKTPLYTLVAVLFFVPPLLAALGYAHLLGRITNPAQRRRARLVGLSLAIYFLALLVGYMNLGWALWGYVESALGIAAASLVIAAYARGASAGTWATAPAG